MSRRTAFLLALAIAAACSKEKPAEAPAPTTESVAPSAQVKPAVPAPSTMTATTTASQTSPYDDALRRFRIAPKLSFTFNEGEGTLSRPRQGMESVKLHINKGADRGQWTATVQPNGVVWTKDGKHTMDVPASLQRLYQFLVFFPDPQKREGSAQKVGDAYEFTNVSGGDHYVVHLAADGTVADVRINDWTIRFR